jgi:hypothetical protein
MLDVGMYMSPQRFLYRTTTRQSLVGNHNKVSHGVPAMPRGLVCLLCKKVVSLAKNLIRSQHVRWTSW